MKSWFFAILVAFQVVILTGCSETEVSSTVEDKVKIGIMLSDVGLGDQSFSDSAFIGLEQAREELGILFDYREIQDSGDYVTGLRELVEQDNDLVVGLGFMMHDAVEKVAKEYPNRQFVIVDSVIDLPNVKSVTFKEHEGSFLIGSLAGLKTETDVVGFVGGVDSPLIQKFLNGFEQGVKEVNPNARVVVKFAGDFGNDKLGAKLAQEIIDEGADYIYPAAGFTGVGVIQQAQEQGVYAFGVDSDQYFLGEKAVVSSMLKKIDVSMYKIAKELVETGELSQDNMVLGLNEDGVGLAPIRVVSLTSNEEGKLNALTDKVKSGAITVQE